MSEISATRAVYRIRQQVFGFGLMATIYAAIIVSVVVGVAGASGVAAAGIAVVFGPPVIWGVRAARSALIADEAGVEIRNPFRTIQIDWSEIESFTMGRYKLLGDVLLVNRASGAPVPVVGVEGVTGQPKRKTSIRARAIAAELNERLATQSAPRFS